VQISNDVDDSHESDLGEQLSDAQGSDQSEGVYDVLADADAVQQSHDRQSWDASKETPDTEAEDLITDSSLDAVADLVPDFEDVRSDHTPDTQDASHDTFLADLDVGEEPDYTVVVEPRFDDTYARWNHYVSTEEGFLLSSGSECQPGGGFYSQCIHSGEVFVADIAWVSDCTDARAYDSLGAFHWMCIDDGESVRFMSTGLNPGKGLSDLLDFETLEWKDNALVVELVGIEFQSASEPRPWHDNPLVDIDTNTAFNTAETVYVLRENLVDGAIITGTQLAIVVSPGIAYAGGLQTSDNVDHVAMWFEGDFDPAGSAFALRLSRIHQSVVRNVRASGALSLASSTGNRVEDSYFANTDYCVNVDEFSSANRFENIATFAGQTNAFRVAGQNNVLTRIMVGNGRVGFYFYSGTGGAASNFLAGVTTAAMKSQGIWIQGAPNTTLMAAAVFNVNRSIDIRTSTGVQIHGAAFTNSYSATEQPAVGAVRDAASVITWTGPFWYGGHGDGLDCVQLASTVACATFAAGADQMSDFSLQPAFLGPVSDSSNQSADEEGYASHASIEDWYRFDTWTRGWGIDTAGLSPSPQLGDPCVTGDCQIWDWVLLAEETGNALNALPVPSENGTYIFHTWLADTEEACDIFGASWADSICHSRALLNAVEISMDGIGNDNLLCEAGEACATIRNLGAYQGHGPLEFVGTGGEDGEVQLFSYANNGVAAPE
ncbi:MAG: hypothetical protein KC561_07070, partial [Myxococcales bacterium]|nr:hypothetical protein [Myxococcales bacterium]